ncbi:class I SAM-dependent methyltransferase [Geodermatophilus sp. YIM 151500]|uniref:class I SAM-dependent DNA methyltransferase n=1 Tax=Geodermatophilus sp. YIM 151500 TaxID=2984531 RepID=UPI0021E4238E|nr:class I SAM-dependent methyltransferase [Geodermatophilus sp. YIM 151500]MCV2487819.1 class I SAM-dependent methyltransferase [Geodermatophilus sp. YIM 151500]
MAATHESVTRAETRDAYQEPLARAHHEGFGSLAEAAADDVVGLLHRAGHTGGLVVDLGCGSGIGARVLGEAGYDVLGVDASPAMLEIARATAPRADFLVASLHEVDIPPCVAVTAVGESVNYAVGGLPGPRTLRALARRVAGSLAPGGVFVLDVAGPGRHGADVHQAVTDRPDWTVCLTATEDRVAGTLTRHVITFTRGTHGWSRSDEVHHLVLFDPETVEEALTAEGLAVERITGYGGVPLGRGWAGWIARR